MTETVRLFWQPGCTSCLRTKEFLLKRGIAFESINVHGNEAGWAELRRLGPQTVPVVSKGDRFVFGQVLDDVAEFLGIELAPQRLPASELVSRLDQVLAAAERGVRRLPAESLGRKLPGRDRSYRQLGHHIFRIPEAFLEAARGAPLTADRVNRDPPADMTSAARIADYGRRVQDALRGWWAGRTDRDCTSEMDTYFGRKPMHLVLERTAWHSAQHTRQLEMVLGLLGIEDRRLLGPEVLSGLPLPDDVWG